MSSATGMLTLKIEGPARRMNSPFFCSIEPSLKVIASIDRTSVALRRADEPRAARRVEELDQRRIIVVDVEQAVRLSMNAELAPRPHLKKLLEGADAAR